MGMVQTFVGFLGRALLSIIFISSGAHKILDWQGTMDFFTSTLHDWLAMNVGNPAIKDLVEWSLGNATLVLAAATILELVGGLLVFLGIWTRLGAFLLIVFTTAATLVFHHFWELQGADRMLQMVMFMKNLSIIGGLLILLAFGKGGKKPAPKKDEKKV